MIIELDGFENSRSTVDPGTGESADEERIRYKISQAVWASRYEHSAGRRLTISDELVRVHALAFEGKQKE